MYVDTLKHGQHNKSTTECIKHKNNKVSLVLTVDAGVLDVDGLRSLFIGCGKSIVDWGEDLQDTFSEARLKHHAATAHTYILTARIKVGNTH